MMKLLSWNVNGLRACLSKGFEEFFTQSAPDVFFLQETKLQPGQTDFSPEGYSIYWNSAERKGYSGTAAITRRQPLAVSLGMGIPEHDGEGRVITLEFEECYALTCYTPNAQRNLARLDYRMAWEDAFRGYLLELDSRKPVIVCGDLNVAHTEIDLKNPKSNRGNAGFSDEEREKFSMLLDSGFADTFRRLNPGVTGAYTWWSYMYNARQNNAGWRIDYFLVSERLMPRVGQSVIYPHVLGSDHCPIGLEIEL